jgi:hypothetical protein
MRKRWRAGERICNLAREFGVGQHNMAMILDGRNYSHVEDEEQAA